MEETTFARYKKSPVREAIFSVTFASPLSIEDLRQFCVSDTVTHQYGVAVPEGEPNEKGEPMGYAVYNQERTTLLRVTLTQLRYHSLGQYPGWDIASSAFVLAWDMLRTQIPSISKKNASIRYINEFDIVMLDENILKLSEYLSLIPSLPDNFPGSVGPFFLQLQTLDVKHNLHGTVTEISEIITDERLGLNIVLDIRVQDAEIESGIGQITMNDFLNTGRVFKNQLFESCITDKTRILFE